MYINSTSCPPPPRTPPWPLPRARRVGTRRCEVPGAIAWRLEHRWAVGGWRLCGARAGWLGGLFAWRAGRQAGRHVRTTGGMYVPHVSGGMYLHTCVGRHVHAHMCAMQIMRVRIGAWAWACLGGVSRRCLEANCQPRPAPWSARARRRRRPTWTSSAQRHSGGHRHVRRAMCRSPRAVAG